MANTIIPKRSSVAGKVPLSTDLQVGEIAVNLADGLIFSKNAGGTVITLGGGTGTVTSVGGTGTVSGLTLSGTVTASGNLTLGGTLAVTPSNFASQTANTVLAAPNGTAGVPTFRTLVAADIPALSYAPTAGSTSITTLGTVTSGIWNATVISSSFGGTGVNNGGRTLAINTNSGTLAFTNAATTLTVANTASVSGTNTGDQTIALTGDVTGTGTGSFATTLATVNANVGTFTNATVTVDAKGRVTAVSSGSGGGGVTSFNTRTGAVTLSSSDVTTALGYTPYNSTNPSGYTSNTGTVTSVSGTGTVSGLTLTGSVTSSGSLTLGGSITLPVSGNWFRGFGAIDANGFMEVGRYIDFHATNATTAEYDVRLDCTASGALSLLGSLTASGNITAFSDERLKTDWADLGADFIERLAAVKNGTYTRIDTGMRQIGVSAQSLLPVAPDGVMDGEFLSVAYGNVALAASVELAKEAVDLRKQVARQESRIKRLESLVEKLIGE